MADSTGGDTDVLFLVSFLMALIVGLVIHSFIIGVNVSDWWRGRSVTPVDLVVTSIGISRMCCQCILTLFHVLFNLFVHVNLLIIDMVYNFCVLTSLWLTSLLSIVLCLKISNIHTRLFLYLRRMMLPRTGHLIVASILLSALSSFSAITVLTNGEAHNTTMSGLSLKHLYNYAMAFFFPLLFYSISSVLLFVSLYHHTTRMKMSSNLSINLETYYSVMRFVSFTFIYYTIYFIVDFVCVYYYYVYYVTSSWLDLLLNFFPALHSSYLIWKTAKLRNQMSKVLQNVMDYFQWQNTGEG
ncbi:hypothetical protein GDO81_024683 [Engystomops pustulosus]|uniref:Taste receptor type 2 n=1 Tax=Engystomops pustulosus TaxID=76066 RepID=A0AAV6ZQX8_ENGPU|nr:hypothetical protein GDO81_024683 [Engystomops pustulosus]